MLWGLFDTGEEHPLVRYRREKAQELRSLSDVRRSYLLRKLFPTEGGWKAYKLCATDGLIGSAILTGLFLLFDLIYQVQGAWYVYLLIYAGLAALFTVLNLKRYRACRAAQKGGKGSGCED